MKQILTIIVCIAILNASCSQSTTTPTVPPATTNNCGYSTDSNQYIELKINGLTLRTESVMLNGAPYQTLTCNFFTDQSSRGLHIYPLFADLACPLGSTNYVNNLSIGLDADKYSNFQDPLGNYDKCYCDGSFGYYSNTTNTYKRYLFPCDSLTINVTSCTTDYVSGTFTGTAFEINWPTPISFTGSFKNLKRNGF